MKDIVYVPVYIEGKSENLPEENGYYFTFSHFGDKTIKEGIEYVNFFDCADITIKQAWIKEVNIWLQFKELPDEEEIKKACPQSLINRISCWIKGANWFKSEILR